MKAFIEAFIIIILISFLAFFLGTKLGKHSALKDTPQPSQQVTMGFSGSNDLAIGVEAGHYITTGSFNLCWGDYTCKDVTTQNCVVDVGDGLSSNVRETLLKEEPAQIQSIIEITLLPIIDMCGHSKERDMILNSLLKIEEVLLYKNKYKA